MPPPDRRCLAHRKDEAATAGLSGMSPSRKVFQKNGTIFFLTNINSALTSKKSNYIVQITAAEDESNLSCRIWVVKRTSDYISMKDIVDHADLHSCFMMQTFRNLCDVSTCGVDGFDSPAYIRYVYVPSTCKISLV